jgi:acetylornithine aminotransferase
MAVTRTIFDVIERERLIEHATRLGEHAMSRLRGDKRIADKVVDVRGRGFMIGIELKNEPQKFVEKGMERGVLLNLTAGKVVRLAPAINITREEWEQGLDLAIQTIADA